MEWMEDDAAAVAQTLAGDRDAFRVLVERHSRSIFRLAYRMTGNEQDAEEVVQETFLRAYRRLNKFESRANFGTWLYRIGVNTAIDYRRAHQRHLEGRKPLSAEGEEVLLALPAADPALDRTVFSSEVQRHVEKALAALSPGERAAFVLRHFEGMSIERIGRTLGLRSSAAKNSVFRAVRKLRRALEPLVSSVR